MKILQLGKFYPVKGGVEKVMFDLCKGLSDRNIHCDMLCAKLDNGQDSIVKLSNSGRVVCVNAIRQIAGTMIAPALITTLRKLIREEAYDIIHIHHPDPMAALALMLSGYKGKVVLHWHSDILSQKTLLRFYKPIQNWLIKRADLILGTTPVYIAQSPHLENARASAKHMDFLPIGIYPVAEAKNDPELESRTKELRNSLNDKKIVFSLGRLVPYKGYTYLIKAAKLLPDDYVVVIGGGGPLSETLQRQIIDEGLENKVKLLGRVDDRDIAPWFNACDIFCLSSIWKTEAFAIVQIEAMSAGKPVVATRIPESGVSWVNNHGESGLNAEPENPESLATCICEVVEKQEEFSKRAKRRFVENFTLDRMIDKCLDFYRQLL